MLVSRYQQWEDAPPIGDTYNPAYSKTRDSDETIKITLSTLSITLIASAAIGGLAAAIIFMLPALGLGLTIIISVFVGLLCSLEEELEYLPLSELFLIVSFTSGISPDSSRCLNLIPRFH